MMAGRVIKHKIAWAVAIAGAYAALGESPATARTLTLTFNAVANVGYGSGCNLWTVTPHSGFIYNSPCGGYPLGMSASGSNPLPAGSRSSIQITAPPGITINDAYVSLYDIRNINNGQGWGGGSFYQGGAGLWHNGDVSEHDTGINSGYWGFAMICGFSQCPFFGDIALGSLALTGTENTGPRLTAVGGNNLWYQGSHWIWNQPGNPFPLTLDSSDVSGVCTMTAYVGSYTLQAPPSWDDPAQWQQCEDRTGNSEWAPTVDTPSYVPGSGLLPLTLQATNAAGVTSTVSETLAVDNATPVVSLNTPNDPNPGVWVNHAVTVDATASAGPSGVGGQSCSVDGGAASSYRAGGLSVDGTGAHTVSCTAWNNAVDPQGNPNTGTSSMTVRIDETPPALSFEPQDPSAPTNVTVDTVDGQSGVGSGSVAMSPAASQSWTRVPSTFDGRHLIGRINDAGLSGPYVVRATSCDAVGNCGSTSEALTMPLRVSAVSAVSFGKIVAPAKIVYRRVLVGWHWQRIRINGTVIRARIGGHYVTVRLVISRNASCVQRRVRTGPHRWREVRACRALRIALVRHERIGFGRPVAVHGALLTAQGVPIAGAPVVILSSPSNGLNQFTRVATVETAKDGAWSASLPPGPSRTIAATYAGSGRVLPASAEVAVTVPASVEMSITPRATRWGGTINLSGSLAGGDIPPAGELVVLRIGWRGGSAEIGHLYTDRNGHFQAPYTFLRGNGTEVYSVWAATARESDYPYAPGRSPRIAVTVHPG